MLKMPEVVYPNLVNLETFGQMGANRLNELPDTSAKSAKLFWQSRLHVFSGGRHDQNAMALQQERVAILVNEAFVCGCDAFKAFQ